MSREFEMKVTIVHEYGRWQLHVGNERQEITAKEALALTRKVAKIERPGVRRVQDYVGMVLARIRADAVKAEDEADTAAERAAASVAESAQRAQGARQKAIERRKDADELIPDDWSPGGSVGD